MFINSYSKNYSSDSCYFTEALTELDKKIIDAFVVFDHAGTNTVDVREVGTIIRSLGEIVFQFKTLEVIIS
jgi:Ca2+-binding EF-hand superfamily protein